MRRRGRKETRQEAGAAPTRFSKSQEPPGLGLPACWARPPARSLTHQLVLLSAVGEEEDATPPPEPAGGPGVGGVVTARRGGVHI